ESKLGTSIRFCLLVMNKTMLQSCSCQIICCRNGLYSPLGIETPQGSSLRLPQLVGMASTARWGLKRGLCGSNQMGGWSVGMASTARWGLKLSVIAALMSVEVTSEWPLQPVGD